MTPSAPGATRIWWLAARPKTLPAAATPVLVGLACCVSSGQLRLLPALATLAGAMLLQLASNFANDVFDFEKGADTNERLGPTRAVQAGWLTPRQMKHGLLLVVAMSLAVGVYLAAVSGPWILGVGLASIVAAIAYTGGPYPLGYNGLGDLFVLVFFGLVAVVGTACVQTGEVMTVAVCAAIPVGCLATNILVVNNLRDWQQDAQAGKRTLVVRLGVAFGLWEYLLLNAIAYAVPLGMWATGLLNAASLLPWLSAPLAIRLCRMVHRERGSQLNTVLASTAKLLLVFGVLFSVSLAVAP